MIRTSLKDMCNSTSEVMPVSILLRCPFGVISTPDLGLPPPLDFGPLEASHKKCTEYGIVRAYAGVFVAATRDKVLHVQVAHGGHLGLVEGGILWPDGIWIDRVVPGLARGLMLVHRKSKLA